MQLILLVDDSRLLRMATHKVLEKAGFSVVTATDGEEAVRMAGGRLPDLIILDMLLPKLGGPDVLRALKSSLLTAHIPVIVLSSLSQKNEVKLKTVGAVAYIEKSKLDLEKDGESLIAIVKGVLSDVAQPVVNNLFPPCSAS
jgi:CheY-like chemotaxis protein